MKKNSIVVLTKGYHNLIEYNNLIRRNNEIQKNVIPNLNGEFDIIIFHEGNIPPQHQSYIQSSTPELKLIFIDVKTSDPKTGFDVSKNKLNYELCPPTRQSKMYPLGYKHMCHFWSIDFLEYLKEYKYIIRIDEDCFVSDFDTNVLVDMGKNDIHFISPYFQEQDEWFVIVGLDKLWEQFITENQIVPFKKFSEIKCPYTNFMIVDIEHFLSNEIVLKFLKKVDESHGIYSNRWGDLPIWGAILSTLINPKNYSDNNKIAYIHNSHQKKIN